MRMYERLVLHNEMSRLANLANATHDPFEKKILENQLDKLILKGQWMDIENDFRGIAKDVKDTVKPYKSFLYILREFYKPPLQGLYNIFLGLYFVNVVVLAGLIYMLGVFTPPSLLLYAAVIYMMRLLRSSSRPFYYSNAHRSLWNAICTEGLILAGSAVSLVRGITQILSWPLVLLRIPFRGLITFFNSGFPTIEDNTGIRRLVAAGHTVAISMPEHKKVLSEALLSKLQKGRKWGQPTNIPVEATGDLNVRGFSDRFLMRHDPLEVVGLFRNAVAGASRERLIASTTQSRYRAEVEVRHRRSASCPKY